MERMTLTVADDSEPLNPAEFADFLYLFRAINLALHDLVPKKDLHCVRQPTEEEYTRYRQQLAMLHPERLNSFFDPKCNSKVLQIDTIVRQSPLELAVFGIPMVLCLAVVFSGGTFSFKALGANLTAKVPSFGSGLKSLREALALNHNIQAGYGIHGVTIKLNKEEYHLLMQQNPDTENDGGFQRFLVGLQHRINRRTRELELSQKDLERIYRYKSNPGKGGWQSRFRKIFGRHFQDTHLTGSSKPLLQIEY